MNYAIRKSMGSLLLVVALMPFLFIICFLVNQQLIQQRMRETLEEKNLQTIVLTSDQFSWIKEGKEILLEGRLFDVKYYSIENNDYHFSGLVDEKETELVKQLSKECDQGRST